MLSPGTFCVISIAVGIETDRTKLITEVTKLLKNYHREVIVDITASIAKSLENGKYQELFDKFKTMLTDKFDINAHTILNHLQTGDLLAISPNSDGGLILCKRYHAELVGPGSAVGGVLDVDCTQVIFIGNPCFTKPRSYQDSQQAYEIRQKWIKYLQDLVKLSDPLVRSQKILLLLDKFFNLNHRSNINIPPDHTIGMLVGVLPNTINLAKSYRQTINPPTSGRKIDKKPHYDSFGFNYFQSPIYSPIF